jgi:tetratricopeptide (TPR) repeat protein
MKTVSKIIVLALSSSILISSCGNNTEVVEDKNVKVEEVDTPEITAAIDEIKLVDAQLMKASQADMIPVGKQLYQLTQDFANKYPNHSKTPPILEVSAKAAEAMGKYDEAINILHKLIYEFPETEETPKYMWNKARVIEEKLEKIPNAKAAYNELINKYPNHPMGIDAKFYVENYLGKTDEEILQLIDAANKK